MTEEIKKLIEEEARICVKNTPNTCSNLIEYGFTKGAQFAYYLCLYECREAERWRKVEEELPEVSNYKDLKCNFLAKTDYGYDIVTYYNDPKFLVGWFANAIRRNVIEWKPIS